MLSTTTIEIVKSTAPLLEEHGETITKVFYAELFELNPQLKNLFNMANQGKGEQSRALSDTVIAYAKNIDQLEALLPAVRRIAHKHVSLGVQPNQYQLVGNSLLHAIQTVLDLDEAHPAMLAWTEAYAVLANVFKDVEQEIYKKNQSATGGWEGFRDFYIDRIEQEAIGVKSFYLKPLDMAALPKFKGGQYVGVKLRPDGSTHYQIRQYSLSAYAHDALRITVKAEPEGKASHFLHQCQVGEGVLVQSPTGVFNLSGDRQKHIFVAGGVGITPLMSMAEQAIQQGVKGEDILFIQCAKSMDHQIFKADLADKKDRSLLRHKLCFEESNTGDHQGYLTPDVLQQWLDDADINAGNSQVYFCGPKSFMAIMKQYFLALEYQESDIHYEVFGPTLNI